MALLIDRMIAMGLHDTHVSNGGTSLHELFTMAHVVTIDNVVEYCREHYDHPKMADIPCIAPPFPITWFEYSPERGNSNKHFNKFGYLVVSETIENLIANGYQPTANEPEAKWLLAISSFALHSSGEIIIQNAYDKVILDAEGKIIPIRLEDGSIAHAHQTIYDPTSPDNVLHRYISYDDEAHLYNEFPCFLAIGFMHCKNVVITGYNPGQPMHEQYRLSKKWNREKGRPLVKYHTIQVGPIHEVSGGRGGHSGAIMPLHICRGHFKVFTAEKPLLGKYVGTYWWNTHVRGNKNRGIVVSSHNVNPSENEDL